MKKIISLIFTVFTAAILCAAARPSLDGRAVVADEGEMPKGLFARTIGYLPGDSVTVTNPANGSTVDVLILGSIDASEGVAIMLSPQAADRLSIRKDSNVQVKITKRTGSLDENVSGTAVLSDENEEGTYGDDELEENLPVNKNEEVPAAQTSEDSPADSVSEELPAEAPIEETLAESPAEAPAESLVEEDSPVEETPVEGEAVDADTQDSSVEEIPVDNDVPPVPEENEGEAVNEEIPAEENVDSEAVDAEVPAEETVDSEAVTDEAPAEAEEENSEKFDEEAPELTEDVPAENVEVEELPENAEAPVEEAVTEEVPETPAAEEGESPVETEELDEVEEPEGPAASKDSETEEYAPIVLVPSEPNPPEETPVEAEVPVEETVEVPVEETVEAPAPVMSAAPVKSGDVRLEDYVKSSDQLEKGKYYLQIATLKDNENINVLLKKYADKYPVVLVPNGNGAYRIMVGPLTADEYGMIKERFEAYGFKDAFLRKIK